MKYSRAICFKICHTFGKILKKYMANFLAFRREHCIIEHKPLISEECVEIQSRDSSYAYGTMWKIYKMGV